MNRVAVCCDVQSLAIDALATISGYDVRRDTSGKPHPLSELVAEYRRKCSEP